MKFEIDDWACRKAMNHGVISEMERGRQAEQIQSESDEEGANTKRRKKAIAEVSLKGRYVEARGISDEGGSSILHIG